MLIAPIALLLVAGTLIPMTTFAKSAKARDSQESEPELAGPIEPLRPSIAGDQVFAELVARNEARNAALLEYTALRTYQVTDLKGKVHAEEIGRMEYRAPDKKTFVVTSEEGSGLIRHMALNPLIASEIAAAAGKEHHDSSITSANYTIELLGEQQVGPYRCFVAQAIPNRRDKYLFEGKVWIDVEDYAVVRIEGHPAKKLSFWIEQADFVRQYQKIDGFWLPQRDETFVQVRLYGKKVLTIDHQDYAVNRAIDTYESSGQNRESF
jgi:outer membrane lipoprotein-sorting protein